MSLLHAGSYGLCPSRQHGRQLRATTEGTLWPQTAPREWNHTLVIFLTEQLGFTQLFSEPSVFFKGAGYNFIAISVHVDDQTIISRSLPPVISLKHALANRFGIDDLGETTYTLGLDVQRDSASGTLLLSQRKFIATILERRSKYVPPPCSIPMDPAAGKALSMQQSPDTKFVRDGMVAFPYRQLIGSLMYLMVATRPNLFLVKIVEVKQ